jgi:hypothetical protein
LGVAAGAVTDRPDSIPPPTGEPIVVNFTKAARIDDAVLFRPDQELMSCCDNVYQEWCPNSNLFGSQPVAEAWAAQHRLKGRVLGLAEASDLATVEWESAIQR